MFERIGCFFELDTIFFVGFELLFELLMKHLKLLPFLLFLFAPLLGYFKPFFHQLQLKVKLFHPFVVLDLFLLPFFLSYFEQLLFYF
jgi:hypothetical protein